MSVILGRSAGLPAGEAYDAWIDLDGGAPALPPEKALAVASELERAFDAVAERWWALARVMAAGSGALLAHAPSCAPNASDLGLMLARSRLVRQWAGEDRRILVLCSDPWLFRHLSAMPGVVPVGPPPPLWPARSRLWARGVLGRCRLAARRALAALRSKPRPGVAAGHPALVVYGHPQSRTDGFDAYFGELMLQVGSLRRVLHTDAGPDAVSRLAGDQRTESLHAWGTAAFALTRLPFARWRPSRELVSGPDGWLVRRAADLEGGTAQAAAALWQDHCQKRWLADRRPVAVAWPWENHGWERALVRAARPLGIRTIGHQHSVIGRQFNIGARGLADPALDLPDMIAANGPSGVAQLVARGVPRERIADAGTLRFSPSATLAFDPEGPVVLAVPFDRAVAVRMIAAARPVAERGIPVWVRDHPLFPVDFAETATLRRAPGPLPALGAVRVVVFAATTVGLEAALAGLPVLRFVPDGRLALDVLPEGIDVAAVEADALPDAILAITAPARLEWTAVFSPADLSFWRENLRP